MYDTLDKSYWPFSFFVWWKKFGDLVPKLFDNGFNIITFTILGSGILILIIRTTFGAKISTNYGSARWATKEEIKKTGLCDGKGVFLGVLENGKYLRDNDKTHTFICAPTRSGQGVGIIIPTLLTWPSSTLVLDIKGENFAFAAGYRQTKITNLVTNF